MEQADPKGKPKDRHRGHGEGTITQRGDKFRAQVMIQGKRLSFTTVSKREAQKWIRETLAKADQGILPADGGKSTVAEFLEKWLAMKQPSIKPRTHELYEYAIRLHIVPSVGRRKLAELRPDHVQSLYADKLRAGLSARTVQIVHRLLHEAFGDAVKWGLLPRNIADAVIAPKPQRSEMHVWTSEQAATFLRNTADDRLGAAYCVLLYCGLRVGELLALRWEDVDLASGRLQVCRTIQRLKGGKGLVVGAPKTARGRRQIVLSAPVIEALKRRKLRQIEERLLAGPNWQGTGYIFTTTVGTPIEQSNFNHYFTRRAAELKLPKIRVHDLRHTCATLLLSKGVHPKVVQELLGHGQISLTLATYSHVLPTMQEEAARTLEVVLSG